MITRDHLYERLIPPVVAGVAQIEVHAYKLGASRGRSVRIVFVEGRRELHLDAAIGGEGENPGAQEDIVDDNAVAFTIMRLNGKEDVSIFTALPESVVHVVSRLALSVGSRSLIQVRQSWGEQAVTFTLSGKLDPRQRTYWVTAPVNQPVDYYFMLLRDALRRVGVGGAMTVQPKDGPFKSRQRLYIRLSDPLRELLERINKDSSKVAA